MLTAMGSKVLGLPMDESLVCIYWKILNTKLWFLGSKNFKTKPKKGFCAARQLSGPAQSQIRLKNIQLAASQ